MSVKQILKQTTVTAKWKLFFFFSSMSIYEKVMLLYLKATDDFSGHPCLMTYRRKWLSSRRVKEVFMRGQSWNIIQRISTPLNPVPNKDYDKISTDISGYWICICEKMILRSSMTEKVVSHPAYEGRKRWPDSQILWVSLSWNNTQCPYVKEKWINFLGRFSQNSYLICVDPPTVIST